MEWWRLIGVPNEVAIRVLTNTPDPDPVKAIDLSLGWRESSSGKDVGGQQ
jgi:hypothetical protein